MMIIKVENESVSDLVLFIHVDIETQDPDIEYKDSDTAPNGKIPCKLRVNFKWQVIDWNDNNEQNEQRNTDSNPQSQ